MRVRCTQVACPPSLQAGDDLLDAPRLLCDAPEDLVRQLALELGVSLDAYLKYT